MDVQQAKDFKAEQRESWDAVAAVWKRWWKFIESSAQVVSDRMLDVAGVQEGHRVLDVATGIGEPALSAARRVGASGSVLASDQAPRMLALARERAEEDGLTNVEFQELDGENLTLPEGSFDAVLCRWGLMFFPDPGSAVKGIADRLRPGGRVATATWGPPPKVPMLSVAMGFVRQALELPPPPSGMPSPFALADHDHVAKLFSEAGLTDVEVEPMIVNFEYESVKQYMDSLELAAPIGTLIKAQPEERQQPLWDGIAQAAGRFAGDDGRVTMSCETLIAGGRKP